MSNELLPLLIEDISVDGPKCIVAINKVFKNAYLNDDFWFSIEHESLAGVPETILTIPFFLNIAPIVWVSGKKFRVEKIDKNLALALGMIKEEMMKMYPSQTWEGEIEAGEHTETEMNVIEDVACLLFSGGLDSVTTSYRHLDKTQVLVTVRGADIKLKDNLGWKNVTSAVNEYSQQLDATPCFIESNFMEFINYRVVNNISSAIPSWWAYVQHGLGLSGMMAVPSYLNGAAIGYIASSHSYEFGDNPWGSSPKVDNLIKWAKVSVIHDGYELSRQGKIEAVIDKIRTNSQKKPYLRVCYISDGGENCCECEKCLRTMSGLIIAGEEFSGYGFDYSINKFVDNVKNMFSETKVKFDENTRFQWQDIQKHIGIYKETDAFISWLKEFDFDAYHLVASKKARIKASAKKLIKKIPGIHRAFVFIKESKG